MVDSNPFDYSCQHTTMAYGPNEDHSLNDLPIDAHSGSWAAWLGGDNNETSIIKQQVTVPTQAPYLTFWYAIGSNDNDCGPDVGDVGGVTVNGEAVAASWLCTDTQTDGWVQDSIDLRAYAGQSITLALLAATDESYSSNFFIDDVSFQASQVTSQGMVTSFSTIDDVLSGKIEDIVK